MNQIPFEDLSEDILRDPQHVASTLRTSIKRGSCKMDTALFSLRDTLRQSQNSTDFPTLLDLTKQIASSLQLVDKSAYDAWHAKNGPVQVMETQSFDADVNENFEFLDPDRPGTLRKEGSAKAGELTFKAIFHDLLGLLTTRTIIILTVAIPVFFGFLGLAVFSEVFTTGVDLETAVKAVIGTACALLALAGLALFFRD